MRLPRCGVTSGLKAQSSRLRAHSSLTMQDFKKLAVWEKAHALVLMVYGLTSRFPREETFNLTAQIRRCATSIPSNIAEGRGRGSDGDMRRFFQIALGSMAELEYQLLLAKDLAYLSEEQLAQAGTQLQEVRRMLISFVKTLEKP